MPRSPRLVEPGGFYHVSPRGNDGRVIFSENDDFDRRRQLRLLERVTRKHEWIVYAYCQMTNHFHLLVQVSENGLSPGMQVLQGEYARYWNRRHDHHGHLFKNRFECTPVLDDRHLMATARYIERNPVRAKMVFRPEQWRWSSYRAHVGIDHAPPFLAVSALLELFGPTPAKARAAYKRFVLERDVSDGPVRVSDT